MAEKEEVYQIRKKSGCSLRLSPRENRETRLDGDMFVLFVPIISENGK